MAIVVFCVLCFFSFKILNVFESVLNGCVVIHGERDWFIYGWRLVSVEKS
jgi:hypothetical protein